VLYPITLMGGRAAKVLHLNPMTPIVEGYRAAMITGANPFTPWFGLSALVAVVLLVSGWIVFHRAEYSFAERV
jgi:ABC-type polysaccharide/polyol phosphate export permease